MLHRLTAHLPKIPAGARPILLTTAYGLCGGLCGGLAAVAFEVSISLVYNGTFLRFAKLSPVGFLAASFGVIVVTSLAAGFLLSRYCPEAAGSGIPQLKLAFWKDFGYAPARVVQHQGTRDSSRAR